MTICCGGDVFLHNCISMQKLGPGGAAIKSRFISVILWVCALHMHYRCLHSLKAKRGSYSNSCIMVYTSLQTTISRCIFSHNFPHPAILIKYKFSPIPRNEKSTHISLFRKLTQSSTLPWTFTSQKKWSGLALLYTGMAVVVCGWMQIQCMLICGITPEQSCGQTQLSYEQHSADHKYNA